MTQQLEIGPTVVCQRVQESRKQPVVSNELTSLVRRLFRGGYVTAAGRVSFLQTDLEREHLVPESLGNNEDVIRVDESVGEWITRLRTTRKIKGRQLATYTGIDHSTFTKLSQNKDRIPSIELVASCLAALKVDPEDVAKSMTLIGKRATAKRKGSS